MIGVQVMRMSDFVVREAISPSLAATTSHAAKMPAGTRTKPVPVTLYVAFSYVVSFQVRPP